MSEHLLERGFFVTGQQIKTGGNGNIICFFARSIKHGKCAVKAAVQAFRPRRVGVRNEAGKFIAADTSADTVFSNGIPQKLSGQADRKISFLMTVTVVDDL